MKKRIFMFHVFVFSHFGLSIHIALSRSAVCDFSGRFLHFASSFLDFAFDLLAGVASRGASDVVGFAFDLFDLTGHNVFFTHGTLLCER
jgi:hypothetical protein